MSHRVSKPSHYSSTGVLDSGFGSGGYATVGFGEGDAILGGLLVQDDGMIIAAGTFNGQFVMAGVLCEPAGPDAVSGDLDDAFGNDGRVVTGFSSSYLLSGIYGPIDTESGYRLIGLDAALGSVCTSFAIGGYSPYPLTLWYQQDDVENVTSVSDDAGEVLERYAIDPFGGMTVLNPDGTPQAPAAGNWAMQYNTAYLFQAMRQDMATGLYKSATRDYSPTLMRWLEPDPSGYTGSGPNLYQPFDSNPRQQDRSEWPFSRGFDLRWKVKRPASPAGGRVRYDRLESSASCVGSGRWNPL